MKKKLFFSHILVFASLLVFSSCGDSGGSSGTGGDENNTNNLSSTKAITAFSFTADLNDGLSSTVTGSISGTNIYVEVPFGSDVTDLVATFTATGERVQIGSEDQVSGTTANDFSSALTYTVTAEDGTTHDYTVTVTISPFLSSNKDITAFSFESGDNDALDATVIGVISGTDIAVTVPFGTDVSALVATFTTDGDTVQVSGADQTSGTTENDFSSALTYTVTAEDSTTQDYIVTISFAAPSSDKNITAFSFTAAANETIAQNITGTISGTTITVEVPLYVNISNLVATFTTNGYSIKVSSVDQVSGTTANDFSSNVTYAITAEDGSTQNYIVSVSKPLAFSLDSTVSHLAGSTGGSSTQDGTGSNAGFNTPNGMVSDGTNLWIADSTSCVIKKMVIATGVVTTIAGQPGVAGSADGVGSAATFYGPAGLELVGTDLYVTDYYNHTIRVVDTTTNTVSTIAGQAGTSGSTDGFGTSAQFNLPVGIVSDGTNLYVCDFGNHTIRQIVIATGEVTTIAGQAGTSGNTNGTGTAAILYGPANMVLNGGILYFTELYNSQIRQMVLGTGVVSNFTISASVGYVFGIVTDGTYFYISDMGMNVIHQTEISTGTTTTLAGSTIGYLDGTGTAAQFNNPRNCVIDSGNLYVTDYNNSVIRKVVISSGVVTTVAGTASQNGSDDGIGSAATFNSNGDMVSVGDYIFITQEGNHIIRKVSKITGEVSTIAGTLDTQGQTDGVTSVLNGPRGLTTDGTYVYFTERLGNRVKKLNIATNEVITMAGGDGAGSTVDATGIAARFDGPVGITLAGKYLYIVDAEGRTIRKMHIETLVVTTFAGTADTIGTTDGIGSAARFSYPSAITTDGTYLYVLDDNAVREIEIATASVTTIVGQMGVTGSTDDTGTAALFSLSLNSSTIKTDGTSLFIADRYNHAIRKVDISTLEVTTISGNTGEYGWSLDFSSDACFYEPTGIALDEEYIYVYDSNDSLRVID